MKNKIYLMLAILTCFSCEKAYSGLKPFTFRGNNNYILKEKIKDEIKVSDFSLSPYAFVENKGQVFGYDGMPHPEVKYTISKGNTDIFLLEKGLAYQFTRTHYPEGLSELMRKQQSDANEMKQLHLLQKQIKTETYRMNMTLVGASSSAVVTTEGKSEDYTNYYDKVSGVYSYNKITYHNIYPGIDWVIYVHNKEIKYDFVVKPGVDPSVIKMQFTGQEQLGVNEDGSFTLKNHMGSITEKKPLSFQGEKIVNTHFVLHDNILGYHFDNYDVTQTLVIDPSVLWATYYGATGVDIVYSCTTDGTGNVYISGSSTSTVSLASSGYQNSLAGNFDAFLVKFNSSGVRQWGTYYGGSELEHGKSCSVDPSGNVYLAGYTASSSGIASGGHQNIAGSSSPYFDAFLAKFNSSGTFQWGTYYGGNSDDKAHSCATDASGNVYISGDTFSGNNIGSGGHQNSLSGSGTLPDAFLVKFNSSGVRQWGTYYGGTSLEFDGACTVDPSGNVYLTGRTASTGGIASGGYQNTVGGSYDAFLVKFNTSGVRQWGTYYGGTFSDRGLSCITNGSGEVYIAGETSSAAGIASGGHQSSYGGGSADGFLVKFNSSGGLLWGTYYGGSGNDVGLSCSSDALGNVYLSGVTTSTGNIASGGIQNSFSAYDDAFLVKFNIGGVRQWGTYFGNTWYDGGNSCAIDGFGAIYLAGYHGGLGNFTGGHQTIYGGGNSDGFLLKLCDGINPPLAISGNTLVCPGSNQIYSIAVVSGAVSYTWDLPGSWSGTSATNTISLTPGSSGTLGVAASNLTCTSAMQTLTVNVSPPIIVNSGAICTGQSFTLNPTGASTYTYSSGSTVVSPTTNTSYSVTGTTTNGCVSMAVSNVTVHPLPVITVNSGTICSGNTFTLVPGGASTYTYSSGSTVVSPTANTSYSVTGSTINGCVSSALSNITVHPLPIISVNSGTICNGKTFTIVPSGATTYSYSGGTAFVSPAINTNYSVTGTSADGCVSAAVSSVIVLILPVITVNNGTICSGSTFTLIPGGASTYTYSGGSALVSPITTSNYLVTGTGTNGCTSTISAVSNISVLPLPVLNITGTVNVICSLEKVTLTASGANNYSWSAGSNSHTLEISPMVTTQYTVSGFSIDGCSSTAVVTQSVDACTGLPIFADQRSLRIYPNPSNGSFIVETEFENQEIKIHDVNGKLIYTCITNNTKTIVDISEQAAGIYFITVCADGQKKILDLIK